MKTQARNVFIRLTGLRHSGAVADGLTLSVYISSPTPSATTTTTTPDTTTSTPSNDAPIPTGPRNAPPPGPRRRPDSTTSSNARPADLLARMGMKSGSGRQPQQQQQQQRQQYQQQQTSQAPKQEIIPEENSRLVLMVFKILRGFAFSLTRDFHRLYSDEIMQYDPRASISTRPQYVGQQTRQVVSNNQSSYQRPSATRGGRRRGGGGGGAGGAGRSTGLSLIDRMDTS
jgi:hypothetical protein